MAKTIDLARSMARAPLPHNTDIQAQDIDPKLHNTDTEPTKERDPLTFGPYGRPQFASIKANPFKSDDGTVTTALARATFPILDTPGLVLVALVKRRTSEATVNGQKRMNVETYVQMANFGRGTGYASGMEAINPAAQSSMDEWLYNVAEAGENWYAANNASSGTAVTSGDRRRVVRMYDADGKLVGSAA